MRAVTFSPNEQILSALQQKHASPGEVFFGLLITQEPVQRSKCNTLIRALTKREYIALLQDLARRSPNGVGDPDKGLFFIGKKANSIARGTGRILLKKVLPPGNGFDKLMVPNSGRPLGTSAQKPRQVEANPTPEEDNYEDGDDVFDAWAAELGVPPEEAFAQAAHDGAIEFATDNGNVTPRAYAQAAEHAAQQMSAGEAQAAQAQARYQQDQADAQASLQYAQQIAFQSAQATMVNGASPGNGRVPPPDADPLHPANRAAMAHRIGLESTYASMPNGERMMAMMGFNQPPPGRRHAQQPPQQPVQPQRRRRRVSPSSIADSVVNDLFKR